MASKSNILQFTPLQSFVNPTFWHKLSETKLDLDRLSDKPKTINGYYTNHNAKSCLMEFDYTAFNRIQVLDWSTQLLELNPVEKNVEIKKSVLQKLKKCKFQILKTA